MDKQKLHKSSKPDMNNKVFNTVMFIYDLTGNKLQIMNKSSSTVIACVGGYMKQGIKLKWVLYLLFYKLCFITWLARCSAWLMIKGRVLLK